MISQVKKIFFSPQNFYSGEGMSIAIWKLNKTSEFAKPVKWLSLVIFVAIAHLVPLLTSIREKNYVCKSMWWNDEHLLWGDSRA